MIIKGVTIKTHGDNFLIYAHINVSKDLVKYINEDRSNNVLGFARNKLGIASKVFYIKTLNIKCLKGYRERLHKDIRIAIHIAKARYHVDQANLISNN